MPFHETPKDPFTQLLPPPPNSHIHFPYQVCIIFTKNIFPCQKGGQWVRHSHTTYGLKYLKRYHFYCLYKSLELYLQWNLHSIIQSIINMNYSKRNKKHNMNLLSQDNLQQGGKSRVTWISTLSSARQYQSISYFRHITNHILLQKNIELNEAKIGVLVIHRKVV